MRLAILLVSVAGASILLSAYSTMLLLAIVGAFFLLYLFEPISGLRWGQSFIYDFRHRKVNR